MQIYQNQLIRCKTGCWLCGDEAFIFELYLNGDLRRKSLASIAACSKDHAEHYFKRFKSTILNGRKL